MNAPHRSRPWLAALLAALLAAPALAAPADSPPADAADVPAAPHKAKPALDDRADPRAPVDNVGKGTHFARKPLAPGAYFDDANRAAVRKYYAALAARGCPPAAAASAAAPGECLPTEPRQPWRIGQPLPPAAVAQAVPKGLRQSLPKVPPGLKYLRVGSDILLVANGSGMVVDGIDGPPRR